MAGTVLVLNANYEPINICGTFRAIVLILSQKASLVQNGRGEIHTINNSYPCPSVIRLEHMVKRPRPRLKLTRREIFRRDNYTCQYCGKKTLSLTVDHILPRHLGGGHTWTNVATACSPCNHRKGGRTLQETGMRLLRQPGSPPSTAFYIFSHHLNDNAEWEPYLAGW